MRYAQYSANSFRNQSLFEKFRNFVYYDDALCLLYYVYLVKYCGKDVEKVLKNQGLLPYIAITKCNQHNILVIKLKLCQRVDVDS